MMACNLHLYQNDTLCFLSRTINFMLSTQRFRIQRRRVPFSHHVRTTGWYVAVGFGVPVFRVHIHKTRLTYRVQCFDPMKCSGTDINLACLGVSLSKCIMGH